MEQQVAPYWSRANPQSAPPTCDLRFEIGKPLRNSPRSQTVNVTRHRERSRCVLWADCQQRRTRPHERRAERPGNLPDCRGQPGNQKHLTPAAHGHHFSPLPGVQSAKFDPVFPDPSCTSSSLLTAAWSARSKFDSVFPSPPVHTEPSIVDPQQVFVVFRSSNETSIKNIPGFGRRMQSSKDAYFSRNS